MQLTQLIGRVGGDAELRYTTAGKAVASFSLAVDNGKDKQSGNDRPPTWYKVTLWEKRAESLAQYITKGKLVYVSGRVGGEAWIDKNNGDAKFKLTLQMDNFEFCGGGKSESNGGSGEPQAQAPAEPQNGTAISDEDIPF